MKSALYAWGGPGTVRLLQTKYFGPKIHEESFLRLYDPEFLDQVKTRFQTTDMFVSFSWGFSEQTEQQDREFIQRRLSHFADRGIDTYAYVQGLNLVHKEFPGQDLFCRNSRGDILFYSKDRAFTCPNNPQAVGIIQRRVEEALRSPFTNIFIDNVLFGLPPLYVYANETSFFGCSCGCCQTAFRSQHGYALPLGKKSGGVITDYLEFRKKTMKQFLHTLSTLVRSGNKGFGINLYDPYWHTAPYYFGYELEDIQSDLDYYLFENHALKKNTVDNRHLRDHLRTCSKPVFIVSYRNGIGRDSAYSQQDIDLLFSEAQDMNYIPCYKATEYKTFGIWHALEIELYQQPSKIPRHVPDLPIGEKTIQNVSPPKSYGTAILNSIYSYLSPRIPNHRSLSYVFIESPLFSHALRKRQYFKPLAYTSET